MARVARAPVPTVPMAPASARVAISRVMALRFALRVVVRKAAMTNNLPHARSARPATNNHRSFSDHDDNGSFISASPDAAAPHASL